MNMKIIIGLVCAVLLIGCGLERPVDITTVSPASLCELCKDESVE